MAAAGAQEGTRTVPSIELAGTVDPATERWVASALEDAEEAGAPLAIIRLDTPGGLDTSMRAIVKEIVGASFPVIVYVSPDGARAASAGLFVTLAADVAAMAPQTNIGSATPVQIGPGDEDEVLGRKVRNDAAAYARALAEGHRRNGRLAERMVRDAENVTASRAERAGLVDVVAADDSALLRALDGRRIEGPKERTLDTEGLRVERRDTPLNFEALQLLVNPTVALLLLLAGIAGIAIEVFSPGAIVPGVAGALALVLGLFGTAQLPITAAGVILILLAFGLLVAETQVPSGGVLGAGGIVALVAGGLLLYDTGSDELDVSAPAAIAAGALIGAFMLLATSKALEARRTAPRTGVEGLVGERGIVRAPFEPSGQVFVHGALWRARAADPGAPPTPGERVRVEAVEGLTLEVRADPGEPEETGNT